MTEFEIDELRRAYHLLGVSSSASEGSIKRAYRRLTKRWHPDRYASGTPAHAEATQMMKLINQAYSRIANAPLRYYNEQTAAPLWQTGSETHRSPDPYAHNPYRNDLYVRTLKCGRNGLASASAHVFVSWQVGCSESTCSGFFMSLCGSLVIQY
jgi:curved DNA-binding protein CbpA